MIARSILEAFPYPLTVSMAQLVVINAILWFNAWRQHARVSRTQMTSYTSITAIFYSHVI